MKLSVTPHVNDVMSFMSLVLEAELVLPKEPRDECHKETNENYQE